MVPVRELLLLLGGNEGDPKATFHQAEQELERAVGPISARSRDHWTEPWGFQDTRLFLNRAVLIGSTLPAEALMEKCLLIERSLGRVRSGTGGYGPRPIDIDILLIGNEVISLPGLQVPHPRMQLRAFALAPAADIVPGWCHPHLGRTILQLLNDLSKPEGHAIPANAL